MADSTPKSYSTDPALYLYTSLTSGSSHIVTATSRLETILKANKIPFKAIDIATDEKARMLWGRRSGKDESGRPRKIPGLVQMGLVIGDLVEIEEWNEYGELKEHVTIYHGGGTPARSGAPTPSDTPSKAPKFGKEPESEESSKDTATSKPPAGAHLTSFTLAMRQAGQEAAEKAKAKRKIVETFTGVGEAEAKDSEKDNYAAIPLSPSLIQPLSDKCAIVAPTILQCPNTATWSIAPISIPKPANETENLHKSSIHIPISTGWTPTVTDQPVMMHRGSSISSASKEYIQQIEEECAIPEEAEEVDDETVEK